MFEKLRKGMWNKSSSGLRETFEQHLDAHVKERETLKKFLQGEKVSVEVLAKLKFSHKCSAHDWLNGEAKTLFGDTQEWKALIKAHNNYHGIVSSIIVKHTAGDETAVLNLQRNTLPKTMRSLRQAVSAVTKLIEKHEQSQDGATPKEEMHVLTYTEQYKTHLDLHVRSRALLKRFLDGMKIEKQELEKLKNCHACEIGQWIYGHGADYYGDMQSLIDFETSHREYHDIVSELIAQYEQGNTAQVNLMLSEDLPQSVNHMRTLAANLLTAVQKAEEGL